MLVAWPGEHIHTCNIASAGSRRKPASCQVSSTCKPWLISILQTWTSLQRPCKIKACKRLPEMGMEQVRLLRLMSDAPADATHVTARSGWLAPHITANTRLYVTRSLTNMSLHVHFRICTAAAYHMATSHRVWDTVWAPISIYSMGNFCCSAFASLLLLCSCIHLHRAS